MGCPPSRRTPSTHTHTRASSAPLSVQDGAGSSPAVLCEAVEGGGVRRERVKSHLPLLRARATLAIEVLFPNQPNQRLDPFHVRSRAEKGVGQLPR